MIADEEPRYLLHQIQVEHADELGRDVAVEMEFQ